MSEAENGTSATAVGRAQSLINRVGDRLAETGAKLQEVSLPPTELPPAEAAAPGRPATERAEETLDRVGERVGVFAAALSHRVRRSAALAREETEDIWAEAQSLRRKKMP